jgi:uncharacterized protein with HEPN domain
MKNDLAYIEHILQSIEKIDTYTRDISNLDFNDNEMIQDAVIRNIEIIGEATKNISTKLTNSYPDIPWKAMAGMRDKLIHDYIGVDTEVVWETIKTDIPNLKSMLNEITI